VAYCYQRSTLAKTPTLQNSHLINLVPITRAGSAFLGLLLVDFVTSPSIHVNLPHETPAMPAFAGLPSVLPSAPARAPCALLSMAAPPLAATRVSRRAVLSGMALAALAGAVSPVVAALDSDAGFSKTPSGLEYRVVKNAGGPRVLVGDLVAIRFRGSYKGNTFDDLFATESPYFYRCGSPVVLKVCNLAHNSRLVPLLVSSRFPDHPSSCPLPPTFTSIFSLSDWRAIPRAHATLPSSPLHCPSPMLSAIHASIRMQPLCKQLMFTQTLHTHAPVCIPRDFMDVVAEVSTVSMCSKTLRTLAS
jgi:hypothetical protein